MFVEVCRRKFVLSLHKLVFIAFNFKIFLSFNQSKKSFTVMEFVAVES